MLDKRTALALALGIVAGLIGLVGTAIISDLWLSSARLAVTTSPAVIAQFLLPFFVPGIAASVTTHVLLLRTGLAPRFTWLMLTTIFIAANFLVWIIFYIVGGIVVHLRVLLQTVQPVATFGLWFLLATLGLRKALAHPDEGVLTKKTDAILIRTATGMNLMGFMMIGPFTPFTFLIGLPAGVFVIVYASWKTLSLPSKVPERLSTGLLTIANAFILYLSLRMI